jgi:hypothetical protein
VRGNGSYKRFHDRREGHEIMDPENEARPLTLSAIVLRGLGCCGGEPGVCCGAGFYLGAVGFGNAIVRAIAALAHDVDRSYARFLSRNPDRSSGCRTSMRVDWPSS